MAFNDFVAREKARAAAATPPKKEKPAPPPKAKVRVVRGKTDKT